MTKLKHEILRRKIGDSRVGRSPIQDIVFVSDLFARLLDHRLRSLLRWHVVTEVEGCEVMKLSRAMESAPQGAIYAVAQSGTAFGGAMILDQTFVYHWIEAVSGCDGSVEDPMEPRDFTSIDAALTEDFAHSVIDCFERAVVSEANGKALGSLAFVRFVKDRASIIDADDATDVLNIRLVLKIGGSGARCSFDFFVPLGMLDVYKAAELTSKPDLADAKKNETLWASTMLTAANAAELRLVAVLHEKKMSIGDVRDFKVGDVLALPFSGRIPVELRIDTAKGVAREPAIAAGALGSADGMRAVRMTEPPREEFIAHLRSYQTEVGAEI